jgi:hypothetical protein
MDGFLCMAGLMAAALSALALYAGSPHCLWLRLRRNPAVARWAGLLLALLSLAAWTAALGVAAGISAMLAGWLLALILQPWLALLAAGPAADAIRQGSLVESAASAQGDV